jgi:heat shock protein HslJ
MPRSPIAAILSAFLFSSSLLALAAAESQPEGADSAMHTQDTGTLEGAIWRLESYKAKGEDRQPISSRDTTLRLEEGRISGSSGCNRLMGSYDLHGEQLSIEVGGMTMMACIEGMEQEQAVTKALGEVAGYELRGDRLVLLGADSNPVLVYAKLKPLSLTGTDWRLTRYNNGKQALVSPLRGTEPDLMLGEDGSLQGAGGCNRFRGGYTLNRDWLAFGPIASTRMACPEPDGVMEQESAYLRALETVAKYRIEGGELTLLNGDDKPACKFRATE